MSDSGNPKDAAQRWTAAIRREGSVDYELLRGVTLADLAQLDTTGVVSIVLNPAQPEETIPF